MLDPGEIHLGGGFTARRMPEGDVLVRWYLPDGRLRRVLGEVRVSAERWAEAQLQLIATPMPKGVASCDT